MAERTRWVRCFVLFFFLAQLFLLLFPLSHASWQCRQCVRGQIYCRQCIRLHHCLAADTRSTCDLLNHIIAQMKFKCDCNKYIPYCEFLEHQRDCPSAKDSTPPARWKCMLKTSLLQCSECKVPLRPPIFSVSGALTKLIWM